MTNQLLYLTNPQKLEFTASVVETKALPGNRIGVILNATYFYPTGGGQEYDTGVIGSARVLDVYKEGEPPVVVHVIDQVLESSQVTARIDAPRRLRHMQHHTAQHLLTQCFVRLCNLETVSANINGYSPSTLDLLGAEITRSDLEHVEDLANAIIHENRQVKSYFVAPQDLEKLPLRRPPQVNENIRIIEIDTYDYSACGGTHCPHTGTIGVVKILKTERQNEKLRIHFVAGQQALEYFRDSYNIATELAAQMSVHVHELPQAVQRQSEQLKTAQRELQTLQNQAIEHEAHKLLNEAQSISGKRLVIASFENRPIPEVRALANHIRQSPGIIALLVNYDGQKISAVVACAQDAGISAQETLKHQLARIGGRGGGDQFIAQGGGVASPPQFQAFLADSQALIRGLINAGQFE